MKKNVAAAHGPRRASARSVARLVAAPLLVLALIIASGTAYADVDWEYKSYDSGYKANIAPYDYPNGVNGATCEFLGYDWDSFSQEMKTNIAGDPDYLLIRDHRIKNLAYQYFQDEGQGVIGEWLEAIGNKVVAAWTKLFGNDQIWVAECSYEEYGNARKAIQKWAYANDGTTGSDDDEPGGDAGGSGSAGPITSEIDLYYTGNGSKMNDRDTLKMKIGDTYLSTLNNGFTNFNNNHNGNCGWFWTLPYVNSVLFFVPSQVSIVWENGRLKELVNNGNTETQILRWVVWNTGFNSNGEASVNNIQSSYTTRIAAGASYSMSEYSYISVDSGGGGIVEPDPYVPTPDVDPTRPIIQIGDVTVDLSNGPYTINKTTYSVVYAPDNSWSIQVETHTDEQYDGDVTAADPTDYTSILNAILAAINTFRQEVLGYYNDIDADLTTLTNSLNNSIKNVETTIKSQLQAMQTQQHQDIVTLGNNLENVITGRWDSFAEDLWNNLAALDGDLIDEIYKDARYIVDNLNFNADFDDSNLVSWLKRIYARLKDKKISIPSPDEDAEGWADAVAEFLQKILSMMVTGLDVAQIATLFDQLKNRFPISIPWDMMAILYLFEGEAVTPEFDWPIYNGAQKVTDLHVDMSTWDEEMEYVRMGELLLFALGLMYQTKWLMNVESEVIDHKRG